MKIAMITPVPSQSRQGNRVTALRWASILRGLGHRVTITQQYDEKPADLMVALHARRSFSSIQSFHQQYPLHPLIVALTGTDLYGDIHTDDHARQSLQLASRLIILQPRGLDELAPALHAKTRVIHQSVARPKYSVTKSKRTFDICVLGHLRGVKDPFRAAKAARLLPSDSRIRVVHVGKALDHQMTIVAQREQASNPRYHWLGERPRWQALRILSRSHAMVLSSRMEGGANVISEALAASVPIIASRISSTIGLLGKDYPGYFEVADTTRLRDLLIRTETEPDFYLQLANACAKRAPLIDPARERQAWQRLIEELS